MGRSDRLFQRYVIASMLSLHLQLFEIAVKIPYKKVDQSTSDDIEFVESKNLPTIAMHHYLNKFRHI